MTHSLRMAPETTGPESHTERLFRVLEAVVDAAAPVGPRGLARTTGIDRSAVGRILQQLADLDVLERTDGGYAPSARLFTLARVLEARDTLPVAIGPLLGALVERFDETCYACAYHGGVAVFTHEVQSSKPLRFVVQLGQPVPLHAGAAGRAILAGLPQESLPSVLGDEPLPRLTPATITDPAELARVAAADRARGYTVSREERVPGGASVAAPFFDHVGRCQGSVVFTAPLARLPEDDIEEIGQAVADTARSLSMRLRRRT
jgi:DNA-binding IclR family transcriptional regulator